MSPAPLLMGFWSHPQLWSFPMRVAPSLSFPSVPTSLGSPDGVGVPNPREVLSQEKGSPESAAQSHLRLLRLLANTSSRWSGRVLPEGGNAGKK